MSSPNSNSLKEESLRKYVKYIPNSLGGNKYFAYNKDRGIEGRPITEDQLNSTYLMYPKIEDGYSSVEAKSFGGELSTNTWKPESELVPGPYSTEQGKDIYNIKRPDSKADSEMYRQYLLAKTGAYTGSYKKGDEGINSQGRSYPISGIEKFPEFDYSGDNHWNVTRFGYAPFFGNTEALTEGATWNGPEGPVPFPKGYSNYSDSQKRDYMLEDVYKYYLSDENTSREEAWGKANNFMSGNIDPKINSYWHNKVGKNLEVATQYDNHNIFSGTDKKETDKRLESYLINFKNMSPEEAKKHSASRYSEYTSQFPKEVVNQDLFEYLATKTKEENSYNDYFKKQFPTKEAYIDFVKSNNVENNYTEEELSNNWENQYNSKSNTLTSALGDYKEMSNMLYPTPYLNQNRTKKSFGGDLYPTNSTLKNIAVEEISKGQTETSDLSTFNKLQGVETAQSKLQKQNSMNNMTPEMLAAYQQMMRQQQMMAGGTMPYASGGEILSGVGAGLAGITAGALGTVIPGQMGDMASQGVKTLHGAIDKDITDEDKMIMGYGQAAGGIGAMAFNPASITNGIDDVSEGLGQGLSNTGEWGKKNAGAINAAANIAGTAGSLVAGNVTDPTAGIDGVMNKSLVQNPQELFNKNYMNSMGINSKAYGGMVPYAGGGMLPPNGGVAEINAGGTHEQNPLGGVPMGQNASVEQGETVANIDNSQQTPGDPTASEEKPDISKFVFSERLYVKDDKGKETKKTFSDKAKKIKNKYKTAKGEDRYGDSAALKAQNQELSQLADEQEAQKAQEISSLENRIKELGGGQPSVPQMPMEGMVPPQNMPQGMPPEMAQGMPPQGMPQEQPMMDPSMMVPGMAYGGRIQYAPGGLVGKEAYEEDLKRAKSGAKSLYHEATSDQGSGKYYTAPDTNPYNFETPTERNLKIGAGHLANSAGDIYNLTQGLRGTDPITFDRYSPENINLTEQRRQVERDNALADAMMRKNLRTNDASTYYSNLAAGTAANQKARGDARAQSYMNEELKNTEIANAAELQNLQIGRQELQANLQAEAKAKEAIQQGLHGIGANAATGIKDVRQSEADERFYKMAAANMGTKDFKMDPVMWNIIYNQSKNKSGK